MHWTWNFYQGRSADWVLLSQATHSQATVVVVLSTPHSLNSFSALKLRWLKVCSTHTTPFWNIQQTANTPKKVAFLELDVYLPRLFPFHTSLPSHPSAVLCANGCASNGFDYSSFYLLPAPSLGIWGLRARHFPLQYQQEHFLVNTLTNICLFPESQSTFFSLKFFIFTFSDSWSSS